MNFQYFSFLEIVLMISEYLLLGIPMWGSQTIRRFLKSILDRYGEETITVEIPIHSPLISLPCCIRMTQKTSLFNTPTGLVLFVKISLSHKLEGTLGEVVMLMDFVSASSPEAFISKPIITEHLRGILQVNLVVPSGVRDCPICLACADQRGGGRWKPGASTLTF